MLWPKIYIKWKFILAYTFYVRAALIGKMSCDFRGVNKRPFQFSSM